MDERTEQRFAQIFRTNIERRSRTAKGKDEGAKTSAKKKHLLLSGDELKRQVEINTENLINNVASQEIAVVSPNKLRLMALRWFDIVTDGLCDPSAYDKEFEALLTAAERLGRTLGEPVKVNRCYRLWTPGYTTAVIPPIWIEKFMDEFYFNLSLRTNMLCRLDLNQDANEDPGIFSKLAAETMAYADIMMDGEIHPWIDGCGRVSTALVMYVARYLGAPFPLFAPNREEHYASIQDIDAHTKYFRASIKRAKEEVP